MFFHSSQMILFNCSLLEGFLLLYILLSENSKRCSVGFRLRDILGQVIVLTVFTSLKTLKCVQNRACEQARSGTDEF